MPYAKIEPINKGWSNDKKFRVTTADGEHYLLRVSKLENEQRCEELFRKLKEIETKHVSMCKAVEMKITNDGIYMLMTWINGIDAEIAIPQLSKHEQYQLGIDAGQMLKLIHSIPAPSNQNDWEDRFNTKMDKKISMYKNCPIQFEGGQYFIDYIEANRHLLAGRPQTFQHGDFHIGNMMVENGEIVIIDFDRFDYGDPWEEFNRIVWCAQSSQEFAAGILDGYFDSDVPDDFWKLLLLYICSNTLSSIPWAVSFGQKEVETMLTQANEVLKWYDNMQTVIPSWYSKNSSL